MAEFSIVSGRYAYLHNSECPCGVVDMHHIFVKKSRAKGVLICLLAFIFLAISLHLFLVKDKSTGMLLWSFLFCAILVKQMVWKCVVKESVVVIPALGVQLETHYMSGSVVRRFVPMAKILKPLLVECVTPVTCYWSLSLIVHGETELMLVFAELRPPVKMLVPIWKALCNATGSK